MAKEVLTTTQINKLFKDTFDNEVGRKCLKHLQKVFMNREIAVDGLDLLSIGKRQGEYNVISKILKEVER